MIRYGRGIKDSPLEVWSATEYKLLHSIPHSGSPTLRVLFSPDGSRFITSTEKLDREKTSSLKLFNVGTGQVERTFSSEGSFSPRAFSSDGSLLLTESYSQNSSQAVLWSIATGERLWEIEHTGTVNLARNTNSLTIRKGNKLGFYDVHTRALQKTLSVPDGPLLFSPDSKLIATGQNDRIEVSTAEKSRLLATLLAFPVVDERVPPSDWIAYTPNGYYNASPEADGFIRWRVGNELYPAARFKKQFHRPDKVLEALQ